MNSGLKHVMRAYKDSGALIYLIVSVLVSIPYSVLNTLILRWISVALDNPGDILWVNLIIAACVINTILNAVMVWLRELSTPKAYTNLNIKVLDKVLDLEYSAFVKESCSSIISTVSSMSNCIRVPFRAVSLINDAIQFCIIAAAMVQIRLEFLPIIIVVYTVGGFTIWEFFRWYSRIDIKVDDFMRKRNLELDDIINGFAEVRSFSSHSKHRDDILSANSNILSLFHKRTTASCGINFAASNVDNVITILTLLYAINAAQSGYITSSIGVTLVMYAWRLIDPLISCINIMDIISEQSASLPKLAKLLDYENKVSDGKLILDSFESSIRFNCINFWYDKTSTVLKDISLEIEKGQKIGICGPTGGGKSTLLRLIPRFYDVQDGSIEIDDIDIKQLDLKSLRSHIGIVHQDPYIFQGTIYDNIIYGSWKCIMDDVIEACKRASIYDFIQSLPDKFNTDVGPKGLKLSGGQKQRIALARIFLANPDIILLDEATSALDNETEAIIQQSLDMFKDKTMIVVAHRLTTIKDSDKIVVIDSHRIAEEGTHDELMAKGGLYAKMYK